MSESIRVRGTGGTEFDIDDPYDDDGNNVAGKALMREQIEKGQLFIVGDDDEDDTPPAPPAPPAGSEPSRGASRDLWVEFALSKGAKPEDLEDLKRDDLVAKYGTPAS